jgi:hypothetical protein
VHTPWLGQAAGECFPKRGPQGRTAESHSTRSLGGCQSLALPALRMPFGAAR